MKRLHKTLLVLFLGLVAATGISAMQAPEARVGDTVITFRFLPENDAFTRLSTSTEQKSQQAKCRSMWMAIALHCLPKKTT